jgi:pantoate--beta-alanine ligase
LFRSLAAGRAALESGERRARAVERAAQDVLAGAGIERIDYVEVRRADDLSALERVEGHVILTVAAWVGRARLIDNMVFEVDGRAVVADAPLF